MNDIKYYLPIKSQNLAFYFVKGCICPTKYLQNRNPDIQNRFDNQILLSKSMFTNETNCSLEIVLNEKTENVIQISDSFFIFEMSLPISRVKKVIFKEEQQKVNTIYDIENGAAFIPLNLIEIEADSQEANSQELNSVNISNPSKNWSKELDLFNRLMGGFAIMSIAGNDPQNYPINYFNTLSVINNLVKDEITNQEVEVKNNQEWAIIRTDRFKRPYDAIYNKITNNTVEKYAKVDKIKLITNNGKLLINEINQDKLTYFVAILASYGDGTRQSIDTFISDIIANKFPIARKEAIALIFGINKGYDVLRNNYKTNNFNVDVKFKLNSQLDYYTIESIYQFAFNNKRNNSDFEYLNWVSEYKDHTNYKDCETYQVLDKTIIIKKKEETGFTEFFQSISRNKIYQKVISEINKCIPKYLIDKDNTEGTKYFTNLLKEDFEEYENEIYNKAKEEIEKELNNKFDKNYTEKSLEIKKLNNFILEKEKQIKHLEEIIGKSKLSDNFNDKDNSELNEPLVSEISYLPENAGVRNKILAEKTDYENQVNNNDKEAQLDIPYDKAIRKLELKELNITKLKSEAKKLNIDNYKTFKSNPDDIDKLIEKILLVESQNSIF